MLSPAASRTTRAWRHLPPLSDPLRERDLSSIGSQHELFDLVRDFLTEVTEIQPMETVVPLAPLPNGGVLLPSGLDQGQAFEQSVLVARMSKHSFVE